MHITNFTNDLGFSHDAVTVITKWLHTKPDVTDVVNVEHDAKYQNLGIDLVIYDVDGSTRTIEVKSDRYYATGNYFFELISNLERGNIGCLLKCRAELLFYYFNDVDELHVFNTKAIVKWWIANIDTFKLRKVATRCNDTASYTSLGCLVPRNQVPSNLVSIIRLGQ